MAGLRREEQDRTKNEGDEAEEDALGDTNIDVLTDRQHVVEGGAGEKLDASVSKKAQAAHADYRSEESSHVVSMGLSRSG